jgi:hypothetical protein
MGLDLVEYAISLEKSFGISIPDADAAQLRTARLVADYVARRLEPLGPDRCLTQQAFYKLRAAASRAFAVPAESLAPGTQWSTVFGRRPRSDWAVLRRAMGAVEWPLFLWGADGPRTRTLGETAAYLAAQDAVAARRFGEPWSRREIDFVVRAVAAEQLGLRDIPWDAEFVRDLGFD